MHGIAQQQRGRHQLLAAWRPALGDGLERASGQKITLPDLDLAFYGDVFLPDRNCPSTKTADAESVLDGMSGQELAELSQVLTEAVADSDIEAAEQQVTMGYTRVPRPVQVLLRAVDRRFGAAAGVLYLGVLRQVYRYLHDLDVKARIDRRVEEGVGERGRVLIGHSLGSVVAYEYLRQHPSSGVELFISVGSPLGLRMVRSRLQVVALSTPNWVTVRDLRDPVACAGPLCEWWPQINADDELIVDNDGDAHSVECYLSKRTVGQVLLQALPHLTEE
ncbi:hypothetical protein [Amycolatopsis camponoti]|uniref:hypothetical protein n=1 Tax=Amycolatopsis camponoti TaxID=2606593 RepID=UPI0012D82774|nr:hypothetical protein [Amycolatopsis camponoti]